MRGGTNGAWLSAWTATVCALAVACAGCKGSANDEGGRPRTGSTRIALTVAGAAAADTARVAVSAVSGEGPDFPGIPVELNRTGTQWNAKTPEIPEGLGRRLDAVAYDASGAQLFAGSVGVDVDGGAIGMASISLVGKGAPAGDRLPIIDGLSASRYWVSPGEAMSVRVTAHDDRGEALKFRWGGTCGTFSQADGPWTRWTAPPSATTCQLSITATNSRGVTAAAFLTVPVTEVGDSQVATSINSSPVINSLSGRVVLGAPMTGELEVGAVDPDGDPLTFQWSSNCASLIFVTGAPYRPSAPHIANPDRSTACTVTVTVTDGRGGQTTGVLALPPNKDVTGPCAGLPEGAACDDASKCTTGDVCRSGACAGTPKSCATGQACDPADGVCKGGTTDRCAGLTCSAKDQCHIAGACDPATGLCSNPINPDGSSCSDGNGCTGNDVCGAGICIPGPRVSCPGGEACDPVDGACRPGLDLCAGKICGALDSCHEGGTCDPATGNCSQPISANGKPCSDGFACTQVDTCQAGVCTGGSPVVCQAPAVCREPDGTCQSQGSGNPVPLLAVEEGASLGLSRGLAIDAQGYVYQGGNIFQPGFDFGTGLVTSAGGSDIFVVKLDRSTGRATPSTWARSFGDATSDQSLQAVAVSSGQVGIIGQFQGLLDLGSGASLTNPNRSIDFVAGLTIASGSGLWIRGVDLNNTAGTVAGRLNAIASTPGHTRFAVCGYVAGKVATSIVNDPAAAAGGGLDIVVTSFDAATGDLIWGKQFGGTGDQTCTAIAFDDGGDVVITGNNSDKLSFGTINLAGPATGAGEAFAYVAKLKGSDGSVLAAASFGSTTYTRAIPRAIVADASGNSVIAGQFSGDLVVGATTITAKGTGFDAFVAKVASSLVPVWATRLGGTVQDDARAVAVDSAGNAYVTGVFAGTADGAASLTSAGGNDAFLLRLDPASGAATFSSAYGDPLAQEGVAIVTGRLAGGPEKDAIWMTGSFSSSIAFAPLPALTCPVAESRKFLVKMQ
jgi:hypothetical protein